MLRYAVAFSILMASTIGAFSDRFPSPQSQRPDCQDATECVRKEGTVGSGIHFPPHQSSVPSTGQSSERPDEARTKKVQRGHAN